MLKVAILPVGQVDVDALQFIRSGLKEAFPESEFDVLETVMPVPREAYSASRRQYHSTRILAEMNNYVGNDKSQRVLGITEVDLFVHSLNFVFGEAQSPGRFALVSLFRLKPEFYGEPPNNQLFLDRALKEAVHELGHTLGLRHCSNHFCIMFFSNSIEDTDRKKARFCEDCDLLVHRVLER